MQAYTSYNLTKLNERGRRNFRQNMLYLRYHKLTFHHIHALT